MARYRRSYRHLRIGEVHISVSSRTLEDCNMSGSRPGLDRSTDAYARWQPKHETEAARSTGIACSEFIACSWVRHHSSLVLD